MLCAKFKWKRIITVCKSFEKTGEHSLSKVNDFTHSFTQKNSIGNFFLRISNMANYCCILI